MSSLNEQKRILIVEDEPAMSELLSFRLAKEGYLVDTACSGNQALDLIGSFKPDLVLLDLVLPDESGYEICSRILSQYEIPVIMLTAKDDVLEKVLGLECGADDYITKPFDFREVFARIKTALKRSSKSAAQGIDSEVISVSDNTYIYINEHKVVCDGVQLDLTPKEYELLLLLAKNKGNVFSRDKLLNIVWGYNYSGGSRTVDIHIRRLRQKLNDSDKEPIIQTVFGVGYKIKK